MLYWTVKITTKYTWTNVSCERHAHHADKTDTMWTKMKILLFYYWKLLNAHCCWYYCCLEALKMSPYGQGRWHSEAKACDTVDMMTSAKYYFDASSNTVYIYIYISSLKGRVTVGCTMHHNCTFLFICETCPYYQQLFKSLLFRHFIEMTLNFKNVHQSYRAAHVVCIVNNIFATTTIQHNDHRIISM